MRKYLLPAMLLVLAAASACKQEPREADKAPRTVEEITRAIIQEVRQVIRETDEQLAGRQPISRELPAADGQASGGSLQLWTENGQAVRLTAITGKGSETRYYFANGELFFASQADGLFIFIGPELKYWLDAHWAPLQPSEADRKARETALQEEAKGYLMLF